MKYLEHNNASEHSQSEKLGKVIVIKDFAYKTCVATGCLRYMPEFLMSNQLAVGEPSYTISTQAKLALHQQVAVIISLCLSTPKLYLWHLPSPCIDLLTRCSRFHQGWPVTDLSVPSWEVTGYARRPLYV
jgi:hypothetical protein